MSQHIMSFETPNFEIGSKTMNHKPKQRYSTDAKFDMENIVLLSKIALTSGKAELNPGCIIDWL